MPDIPYQNDPDDPGYGAPISAPQVRRKDPSQAPAPSYEKELIRLMITHGYPVIEFVGSHVNADHFESDTMRTLFDDLIARYTEHQPIALDVYLTDDRWKSLVSDMAMERHTPSARHEEKLGKKLTRDGDTLRTVKGELKALKMHYLDRLKVRFKETFDAASDPAERESSSRLLTEVAKERLRIEKTSADHLF
jgi:predicted GIY-YIG superfamily endonuclease